MKEILLPDALRTIAPGTVVHLGSKSCFIDVAPVEEMLKPDYLDNLTRQWSKEFNRLYVQAGTMYDMAYRLCDDPKKVKRLQNRADKSECKVADFIPFHERKVKEIYQRRLLKDGIVVIIEGDEIGRFWDMEEKQRSVRHAKRIISNS